SEKVRIIAVSFPHDDPPLRVETAKSPGGEGSARGPVKRAASGSRRIPPVQPPSIPGALPPPADVTPREEPAGGESGAFVPATDPSATGPGGGGTGGESIGSDG